MNLPNKITMVRIIMIPFFIAALLIEFPFHQPLAAALFVIAALSDSLDGYLARSRNLVTDFGKFMDPLADKLLVCSALICFVQLGSVPAWIVIIIIAREFAITGLRTLAAADGIVIAASKWGKAKTMSQMIAIVIILIGNWPFYLINIPAGTIMIYIATVMTIISGVDYFIINKKVFRTM
ncbi:CDP-diacylglycerol--glycerol-3-phosphate 3-phosphatidyltransferase [Acetobacterium paludosum]|uniref:CDP-diacylglycerol--glycerol-3-phosphate 3-phosphatidyltransferase n=1 Tax=Acetobacterium paludosum TaxID=52693 RepID=A0A923HV87_9FIRM|nr:CDP-diacylglycerol--glycerol-3-phosphate 3-phosphatidyltransferase [Acetobacterium paludosum]MBC3888916.1 CDP-diacylglycerol--glycerol-3-phosphate 3-phosphatidyltransferase [Acetobacterium paludosum]